MRLKLDRRFQPSRPILLAEIAPSGFNVIDGNHRVGRARRDGVATLPCYRIRVEQHLRFLITTDGHRAYVKYWNGKMRERERSQR